MDVRKLGTAGLVSSAIGLGTAAFTGVYGPVSKRDCRRTVRLALDSGITMLDTADFYAGGEVERLIGESLAGHRDAALIATHAGLRTGGTGRPGVIDGDPAYLGRACDASLRRLRTDRIDLCYLGRVDPKVPVEDSVGKLAELVAAGKIRYLGLCQASADQLRRAHETHPISALAVEYSLRRRSAEGILLTLAAELGVGVVAYCPLDRGLLAGGGPVAVSTRERTAMHGTEAEAALLDLGMTRLALAWLLARRGDVVPVPGTRSLSHLEMDASTAGIRLAPETCARLAALWPCERQTARQTER
jgi:aryl-alcohol dehydrogenase-like predicted oxidoreductase